MLVIQQDNPETKASNITDKFLLPPRQSTTRAEVRTNLRGHSVLSPIRRANFYGNCAFHHCESSCGIAAITPRQHSAAAEIQCAPISEDQSKEARLTIGLRACDSIPFTTCTSDLETAVTKQLPPVNPRSVLPRAAVWDTDVNRNRAGNSRPRSANFSSTFLINTPGHACVIRSNSFKTLHRWESTDSCKSSTSAKSESFFKRCASYETALPIYSEKSDFCINLPPSERLEGPLPRLRSFASIGNLVTSNPNAKLPPAHPPAALRNGATGMLASNQYSNSPSKHQSATHSSRLHDSTSSTSLESSSTNIIMTGGGPEPATPSSRSPLFLPKEEMPSRKSATRPVVGRHYSRIQLPCTKASSRTNARVMTDSLKLYEEQIFSRQISNGQRPLSWCIEVGSLNKSIRTPDDNNSSGSPSTTNSSSTMSSACSSSSSSNTSHAFGPSRITRFNRPIGHRSGAIPDSPGLPSNAKGRHLSPIIHAIRPCSPQCPPLRLYSPPVPPGATNRVPSRICPTELCQGAKPFFATSTVTPEASTPNAEEQNKTASAQGTNEGSDCAFASSLSTVRPTQSITPSPPPPPPFPLLSGDDSPTTLATVTPDDSFPTPSLSLLPPPPPWNSNSKVSSHSNAGTDSVIRQLFVCPYCRALPTLCRCSASLSSISATEEEEDSRSFECDSEGEEKSTYAFSTLDSDFISWMRLSVKAITSSHPYYASRRTESMAALTQQEVIHIVDVFNRNLLGLRMALEEGTRKLVGTIRVYINLIKPVKMSLRQTMRQMPLQTADAAVPDRLISFFLPRGGSRLFQLSGSTSTQEVIQCLLERFHIQESASRFALYEHTLETQTVLSRKLHPSERPLTMLMHWVRLALATGEDFAVAVRRKRIVLQENENWEVNWSDFTPAELMNFLRILEKEEAEYRNAIYFQYGLVRQQIEQRMAQLSAQDRLLAARHLTATSPLFENLEFLPTPQQPPPKTPFAKSQTQHASF